MMKNQRDKTLRLKVFILPCVSFHGFQTTSSTTKSLNGSNGAKFLLVYNLNSSKLPQEKEQGKMVGFLNSN